MENDEKKTPVTATTPPIVPTEPAPIPLNVDPAVDLSDGDKGRYYCPMKCEGDKMYDQPGNCPVCGMNLVLEKEM